MAMYHVNAIITFTLGTLVLYFILLPRMRKRLLTSTALLPKHESMQLLVPQLEYDFLYGSNNSNSAFHKSN